MSGLRFCMLTTFYPPHNFGGDGIAIQRLARALVRRGHEVTVVHDVDAYEVLRRGPEPAEQAEPDGLTVVRLRSRLGPLSPLLTQQMGRPVANGRRIRRIVADGRFDVLHFNNVSLIGGPGLLAAGRGIKLYEAHEHWLVCPTHVLWRHGREVCTERQCVRCQLAHGRPPQLWRHTGLLERRLGDVDCFIAKSEFSRAKHREFGFPRDMDVLPYFLPDAPPPPEQPQGERPHDRPYFLFVGRLERIKGLDDVIPAFLRYEDADLLIAGDGEHGDALRALGAGSPRVRFLGRVPPDELRRYYAHAVALVVPSVCFETFGIILIEAFREGTPVVARAIGPFPEIVERSGGGLLFRDADELVAALRRLQGNGAVRDRMAAAAYQAFREHWSESAVVPRYLDIVRRVAERRGATRVVQSLSEESAA